MLRNIIFDMGNVLISCEEDAFMDWAGVKDPAEREFLRRTIYKSADWKKLDAGILTEAQLEEKLFQIIPKNLQGYAHKMISCWDENLVPVEGMAEFVRRCKAAGYHIYLLSNASVRQKDYWGRVPGSEYFDGRVVSAEVHMQKPEKEIYLYILRKFELTAGECVFIDDKPENVRTAKSVGMHGILFEGKVEKLYDLIPLNADKAAEDRE